MNFVSNILEVPVGHPDGSALIFGCWTYGPTLSNEVLTSVNGFKSHEHPVGRQSNRNG